jgi:hypothetical protein
MIRLYYDIEALEESIQLDNRPEFKNSEERIAWELANNVIHSVIDITEFFVLESSSKGGAYVTLGTYDYITHQDFIQVDDETSKYDWFKLCYVDSNGVISEPSDPMLGEDIVRIILIVAQALGDINRDDVSKVAFTDEEYILKIKEAIRRYKGSDGNHNLMESDLSIVALLVRMSCCYDLAYDNARFYRMDFPEGLDLYKGDVTGHYLKLAESLERQYKNIMGDWDDDNQAVKIIQTTKTSHFSTRRLPLRWES